MRRGLLSFLIMLGAALISGPYAVMFESAQKETSEADWEKIWLEKADEIAKNGDGEMKPLVPRGFAAEAQEPYSVLLTWKGPARNMLYFQVDRREEGEKFFERIALLNSDARSLLDRPLKPGTRYNYRIRAIGRYGASACSNIVDVATMEATGKVKAETLQEKKPDKTPRGDGEYLVPLRQLSSHSIKMDQVSGRFDVENPGPPAPQVNVIRAAKTGKGLIAGILFSNSDPYIFFEDVRLEAAGGTSGSVAVRYADFGEDCVKEGIEKGKPPGNIYTEKVSFEDLDLHYEETRIGPGCCGAGRVWNIESDEDNFTLALSSYGREYPFDFRKDPRFSEDLPLWVISASSPGVPDGRNVPGSPGNATSRPISHVVQGEVFAVSVSVEADDSMERQSGLEYDYFSSLSWVLTYDPNVVGPVGPMSDAGMAGHEADDGWDAKDAEILLSEREGWIWVKMKYADWSEGSAGSAGEEAQGRKTCSRCGQEGFYENGMMEGADLEQELTLAVFYFQAKGESGEGTVFSLAPGPQTAMYKRNTNGTPSDTGDDIDIEEKGNLNPHLPAGARPGGRYQVQEAFICIR